MLIASYESPLLYLKILMRMMFHGCNFKGFGLGYDSFQI